MFELFEACYENYEEPDYHHSDWITFPMAVKWVLHTLIQKNHIDLDCDVYLHSLKQTNKFVQALIANQDQIWIKDVQEEITVHECQPKLLIETLIPEVHSVEDLAQICQLIGDTFFREKWQFKIKSRVINF